MKRNNQIVILYLFALLILAACSKKEDEKIAPSILIGKWKDMGIKGSLTIVYNNKNAVLSLDDSANVGITEFKVDSTITNYSEGDLIFTRYTNTSKQITFLGAEQNKTYNVTFNFALNGNTLLLSMDKELFGKNVANLKASGVDSYLADFNEFIPNITEFKYEHTLIKQ